MVAGNGPGLNEKRVIDNYAKIVSEIKGGWVPADTAVLVIHGIGHQNPLETLDGFARGLVEAYPNATRELELEHQIVRKKASDGSTPWFDNVLRIKKKGAEHCIDVYEFYWAHETEGKASFDDLQSWLHKVTHGAKKFYKENEIFAMTNKDDSPFISGGKFSSLRYYFFVSAVPQLLLLVQWISSGIYTLLSGIPIVGNILRRIAESAFSRCMSSISNVLNDITIYNTTDAKSGFFKIRNCILDGAVGALRFLLEAQEDKEGNLYHKYPRVLLAGHSLGSQVAFDAINRLNHLVNQGEIKSYGNDGRCSIDPNNGIAVNKRLIGLVTFGSPLDKIAFFFREQVSGTEYLRRQMLASFHGFKQRQWMVKQEPDIFFRINHFQKRLFESLQWYNYWDSRDYVSGSLDFYTEVTNINCQFKSRLGSFTHSNYWECKAMYAEVYKYFLLAGDNSHQANKLTITSDNVVGEVHIALPHDQSNSPVFESIKRIAIEFMNSLGFDKKEEFLVIGPTYQKLIFNLKDVKTGEEVELLYKGGEAALKVKAINSPTTILNEKLTGAALDLISVLGSVNEGVLRFGTIVLVKVVREGKTLLLIENVSPDVASSIYANPSVLMDPGKAYSFLMPPKQSSDDAEGYDGVTLTSEK